METEAPGWPATIVRLLAWVLSVALIILDLAIVHFAALKVMAWMRLDVWTVDFWYRALLLILGCTGLAFAIVIEYHYRRSRGMKDLIRRVLRAVGIIAAVGVVGLIVQVLF